MFQEVLNKIKLALKKVNGIELGSGYDALLVKPLASSNLIKENSTSSSKQSHIALSGKNSRDFFPYINILHYTDEDVKDESMKSFYVLQVPMTIYEKNVIAAKKDEIDFDFSNGEVIAKASVKLSRPGKSPQIELGNTSTSDGVFKDFRKLFYVNDVLIILKRERKLEYEAYIIKSNEASSLDLKENVLFLSNRQKSTIVDFEDVIKENKELESEYKTKVKSEFQHNRIIFGAPGTGKSYKLNQDREELLQNEGDFERVTFHPDYSYANFVGTYKPVMVSVEVNNEGSENTKITRDEISYEYVPGPFMRTYVKALKSAQSSNLKPHLLMIEEINRANVAAVFGEVFQLLDRDVDNASEYTIQASEDIKKYLAKELGGNPQTYSEMRIPNNMFIWATMNSADQGVFPMDTAFKRRWDFTYIGINHNERDIEKYSVTMGRDKNSQMIEWNKLRKAINNALSLYRINEDKLLGPYFLSRKIVVPNDGELIDSKTFNTVFKSKVLMYLFEDAAKQKRASLFEGCKDTTKYSSICEAFDELGVGIFCKEIRNEFPINTSMVAEKTEGYDV